MIDPNDPDVQALVAALASQVALKLSVDAAEAEATAIIDRAFAGLVTALDYAVAVERERRSRIADAFDGLSVAVERACRLQVEAHATRALKVAIFDAEGVFVGTQDGRADQVNLLMADGFTRLAWRPEWDDLPLVADVETGPRRFALRRDVPRLADIPNAEAEVLGQLFGMFASEVLRPAS